MNITEATNLFQQVHYSTITKHFSKSIIHITQLFIMGIKCKLSEENLFKKKLTFSWLSMEKIWGYRAANVFGETKLRNRSREGTLKGRRRKPSTVVDKFIDGEREAKSDAAVMLFYRERERERERG